MTRVSLLERMLSRPAGLVAYMALCSVISLVLVATLATGVSLVSHHADAFLMRAEAQQARSAVARP